MSLNKHERPMTFCKHGYHHSLLCLACQAERKAQVESFDKTKAIETEKSARRKQAMERIMEAAKRLEW